MKLPTWDERILLLMRHAKENKWVETEKEFLQSIGMKHPENLHGIRNKTRSFTLFQVSEAARIYKINLNWIFGFESNMKRSPSKSALQNLKDAVRAIEGEL